MRVIQIGGVSLSGLEVLLAKPGSRVYVREGGLDVQIVPKTHASAKPVRHQYTCWLPNNSLGQLLQLAVDLEDQYIV